MRGAEARDTLPLTVPSLRSFFPLPQAERDLLPIGQGKHEPRTLPGRAVHGDVATHRPRQPPRDIQPEPAAARLTRVDAFELFEDPLLIGRRDALALIGDDDGRYAVLAL